MADRIDLAEIRSQFETRHEEGKLIHELPFMKAVMKGLRKPNATQRTAKSVYELALQVTGIKDEDIQLEESIPIQQAIVYAIIGGGFVGGSATRNPQGFYLDDRRPNSCLNGKKSEVYREVIKLTKLAEAQNLNPNSLPHMPNFHNMGVL